MSTTPPTQTSLLPMDDDEPRGPAPDDGEAEAQAPPRKRKGKRRESATRRAEAEERAQRRALGRTTGDEVPAADEQRLADPALYIHPELSRLAFNDRVLAQASDRAIPLLERLRFLTIASTNLDEFFEVRAAGLKEQVNAGIAISGPDGLTPGEAMRRVSDEAHRMVAEQYRILNEELLPELAAVGVRIKRRTEWSAAERAWLKQYFRDEVLPVLSPIGLDPAHPFPRVQNKSLNFIVTMKGKDVFGRRSGLAVVQAPRCLPRLIRLPSELGEAEYELALLSSVIHAHLDDLFPGMAVNGCYQFRVTRNSDLWVDEEEVDDLLHALAGELPRRRYGEAVRLEVADNCDEDIATFLLDQFDLGPEDLYQVNGPVNLHRLSALVDIVDRPALKYTPFVPDVPPRLDASADMFALLRDRDVLLHHPYQSFVPVVDLVRQAAQDPGVLAIKMTLYRTGAGSPVVDGLIEAARNGKEVTAVVELRARFDEEANIDLATRLHEAGAQVVYGVVGYKTHAKMLLIVRREETGIRRYVHMATGNYHARTARAYTDFGFMTSDPAVGEDVHALFQQLTGLGKGFELKVLLQSPFTLRQRLHDLIAQEAANAQAGKPARIVARVNNLSDPSTIRALYRASQAGVRIDLIVRTICCLRPGVPGVSETIRVRSIVGRFLEHSRVFWMLGDGEGDVWCSSGDWMPRNLYRRVELAWPVRQKGLARRVIREALELPLEDDSQAWDLQPDGTWVRCAPPPGERPRASQAELLASLAGADA